jgi:hypothetical protein
MMGWEPVECVNCSVLVINFRRRGKVLVSDSRNLTEYATLPNLLRSGCLSHV